MATIPKKPTFELHGLTLHGSFNLYFTRGKWNMTDFQFFETIISNENLKKLIEASKSGEEVPLRVESGEGKVKIGIFYYDPRSSTLTDISFELIDWTPK